MQKNIKNLDDSKILHQNNKNMSFFEHFEDLRKLIIICLIFFIFISIICFYFREKIFSLLIKPIELGTNNTNVSKNITLIYLSPAEAFISMVKISLTLGFVVTLPIILNRIYWFISPALKKNEKSIILPLFIISYILFMLGIFFAYYFLLPFGINFLIEFSPSNVIPMISIDKYISFSISLLICTSLIFLLPILIFLLTVFNIINLENLTKNRHYAILISFILGAIITPSIDIFTQTILSSVLYLLYEISIIAIKVFRLFQTKNIKI